MPPYLMVDDVFSVRQYPYHVISATEEPSGHEAFRVADMRRSEFDFATATTPNAQWSLKVVCDQPRGVSCVRLDRGHNLAGERVIYEVSNDDFTTTETVFDITALPANPGAGSLDDALGVVTEEGAWLIRVPVRFAKYQRLRIPAMGTGLLPVVVGLGAGVGWAPPFLGLPTSDNQARLVAPLTISEAGWLGAGAGTRQRRGELRFQLTDLFQIEDARFHVEEQWGRRRPLWIVQDDEQAHRAVLAVIDDVVAGFDSRTAGWFYGSAAIPWIEYEPKRT